MTAVELASLPHTKVPVWQTLKAAYRTTLGNLGAAATAAVLPFILSMLIDIALPEALGGAGAALLRTFLATLAVSLFELAWLRYLLLGREAAPYIVPKPNRRLKLFIGYTLLLTLLTVPALLIHTALAGTDQATPVLLVAVVVILYAFGSYLWVRFGFVFLWIALDSPERLGASWRTTRRNGVRILLAVLLVGLPLLLPFLGFGIVTYVASPELGAKLENGTLEGAAWWAVLAGGHVLFFLYYALSCAVLVHAFSALTGWVSNRHALLERFE